MLKKIKLDSFVIAILGSIILAYVYPQPASSESKIPIDIIGSIGISLIFFFYGLTLRNQALKSGLSNWKLHLTIQGSTFLLFPLLILIFYPFAKNTDYELMWFSFLFLAALPSTVSSSVVMVSIAKGNLPGAIFNASISGILGILFTPFWIFLFIRQADFDYDLNQTYIQLITEIVIPLLLGLWLRRFFGVWAKNNKRMLTLFDKSIILLIVYKSFARSFEDQLFHNIHWTDFVLMGILVILLFIIVYALTGWIGKLLKFNHADQITNQFCSSKKSLVHGTVFSQALFGGSSILGMILLPLMIYHAFQIFIISIIAVEKGKKQTPSLKSE